MSDNYFVVWVSVLVNSLLHSYKECCRAERQQPRDSTESPAALLPVSYAQAKDWLLKQQRAQSEPLQIDAVNAEEAREVVADLNRSLAEQPASTAALLKQPTRHTKIIWPKGWGKCHMHLSNCHTDYSSCHLCREREDFNNSIHFGIC